MYLNAMVSRQAFVSVEDGFVCVKGEDGTRKVPFEDLNSLMLEGAAISISKECLTRLAENGTAVFVCNEKHMPTGILLPFAGFHRRLSRIRLQIEQPKPRIKRLWQQIIQQKIRNQGRCLKFSGKNDVVSVLAESVFSGDTTNVEAVAAAKYFKELFGENFFREEISLENSMLNYGYAIIRAIIAREIAIHGFEPCLGIFHCNEQNAYNFADDLIEPFRPVVDCFVANAVAARNEDDGLSKEDRQALIALQQADVLIEGKMCAVTYAIELFVESVVRYFEGTAEAVSLPELIPLQHHRYE